MLLNNCLNKISFGNIVNNNCFSTLPKQMLLKHLTVDMSKTMLIKSLVQTHVPPLPPKQILNILLSISRRHVTETNGFSNSMFGSVVKPVVLTKLPNRMLLTQLASHYCFTAFLNKRWLEQSVLRRVQNK